MNLLNSIFSKDRLGFYCFWLVVFLAFGYPFSASIAAHLGVKDAELINAFFRALYLGLALFLIGGGILYHSSFKLTWPAGIFLAFLIIYLIRFFYDVEVRNLRYGRLSKLYLYAYAIGNTFLPVIAILLTAKYSQYNKYLPQLFWFLLLLNVLLITYVVRIHGLNLNVFMARNMIDLDINDKSRAVIGPITYSFTGEVLAIFSLFKLLIRNKIYTKKYTLALTFGFLLGFSNLMLGASRSPFLGFVLTSFLIIIYYLRNVVKDKFFYFKLMVKTLSISGILFLAFSFWQTEFSFYTIERFKKTINRQITGQGEHRNGQWAMAWDNFKLNPVAGDSFIVRQINHDAHNVFLEAFMSVGFLGAFFFYIAYMGFLGKMFSAFIKGNQYYFLMGLMMVAASLAMLTSANIFMGYKWMPLLVYVLSIPIFFNLPNKTILT